MGNNIPLRALTLNNLGCLCRRLGILEKALNFTLKALNLHIKFGLTDYLGITHLNLSAIFIELKK